MMPEVQEFDVNKIKVSKPDKRYKLEKINLIKKMITKGKELPPIVIGGDNYILDGHTRFIAYRRLGYKKINVIKTEEIK